MIAVLRMREGQTWCKQAQKTCC